jgi:hypothetical protein
MVFLDCPAYLDKDGAARCGLPAEVSRGFTRGSTDGPLESAVIRCAASSKPSASASLTLKGPARRPPRRSRPARARGTVGTTAVKDTAALSGGCSSGGTIEFPAAWPQRDADLHRYGGMDKTVAVRGNVS